MKVSKNVCFQDVIRSRPALKWLDVSTGLDHFSIVTYLVMPEQLEKLLPPPLKPETIEMQEKKYALLSVVSFIDANFYIGLFPFFKFNFPQTNYRIYVIDSQTGERGVWFLGTTLGSYSALMPRLLWQMPWYYAEYNTDFQLMDSCYTNYWIEARSKWSNMTIHLKQTADQLQIDGFPDLETALVILTHPFKGYFTKKNGQIGTYSVWHEPLNLSMGECLEARFDILDQLGLVSYEQQSQPFNVLLQKQTQFIIQLPPKSL